MAIVFRKDKLNSKGEGPLHFRITKNRKSSYITSGIRINPRMWNEKRNRVKTGCPNSARLNSYITSKFAEIQDTVLQHETASKSLTSKSLKERIFGKKSSDFFAFADMVLQQYMKEGRIGTHDKNRSVITKLKAYRPSIMFQDITPEFLKKYEQYLRDQLGNKINTIGKDMKFIRKVINDAICAEVIEQAATPFLKYHLKNEKTNRDHLTEDELLRFELSELKAGYAMAIHRDIFVFATYTAGLRISDVVQLLWGNFDGSHLHLIIQKTGAPLTIKVPNKGLEILSIYRKAGISKTDYIFPLLPPNVNRDNPVVMDGAIASLTAMVNRSLKKLARMAGIEKRLSFHISRHTFAVMALRKGISIDKVSKLLGHSSIRETQVYAKIVDEELDNAMEIFNNTSTDRM
jgi:integrase/recombinase XerD